MRKLLSVLSSTLQGGVRRGLLFFALLATTTLWAHDFSVNGIYYNFLDGNNVAVTYRGEHYDSYSNEYSGEVIIPETVVTYNGTTYSVTSIGNEAFRSCTSLTSITIPNSVTSIGFDAFAWCDALTSVTIPNSVTSIGDYAFYDCSSLTSITIPNSVTSIGDEAFSYCTSLTSITIPNSVTSIGDEAFSYCTSLTSITIPNSVTSIGSYAFDNCTSLTSVTIGNSVTSIGYWAFSGCIFAMDNFINNSSLDAEANNYWGAKVGDVEIDGLLIRNNTLIDCRPYVTTAVIPESVTSIGDEAFRSCPSLTSVTIPNSVTSIGYAAVSACSSLTSVTIGNSVTSIGEEAFRYCSSLTSVTINSDAIVRKAYSYDSNISHIFGSQVTEYIIGESVTSIGDYAFFDCSSLTSITIPNSVTSIGYAAFYGCSSLTSITIPNSVTSIGYAAFYGCSSLTSITIPNSVTSIGDYAFNRCTSLASITIPNSVTSIGYAAFYGCSSLSSPVYNAHCFAYMPPSFEGAYTIPDGIKQIAGSAFSGCSSLTSITIPNSVTSIGGYAFRDCTSLTSVTIGNSVTSIGDEAFSGCIFAMDNFINSSSLDAEANNYWGAKVGDVEIDGLLIRNNTLIDCRPYVTTAVIPEIVTSIGGSAFSGCSSLTSITIPNSVTSIGGYAFRDCSSLTSITIPNSVTSIGEGAFYGCFSLTSITIGNGVTSIGDKAFHDCIFVKENFVNNSVLDAEENNYWGASIGDNEIDGLLIRNDTVIDCRRYVTSAIIPNRVTSIGVAAFWNCSSLTSITIPNSVTSIGYAAFWNCSSLTSITIPNSVTSIGSYAFAYCTSLASITIPNSVTSIGYAAFYECDALTSITCEATIPPTIETIEFDIFLGIYFIPVYVPCGSIEAYYAASGWSDLKIKGPLAEYSIEVYVNDIIMGSAEVNHNTFCEGNQISATPYFGYHFVQWSDGNTENPRTLELTQDTTLTAEFAQSFSGQCGDSLYWELVDTTLHITGKGEMYDYKSHTPPWKLLVSSIKSLSVSEGTTSIGRSAFYGCSSLTSVTIPNSVTSIGEDAFWGCRSLTSITIPNSVTSIGEDAFRVCNNITSVTWNAKNCNTYNLGSQVTSFEFGNKVEVVPSSLCKGMEKLTSITIPNSVKSIGTSAFEGCTRLGKISLGTGLEDIAANAFAGCNRLHHIYCYPTYPPFADQSSFANYNVYLHVPCDYQEEYDLDMVWGNFKYIECMGAESEPSAPDTVIVIPSTNDVTITWPTEDNADTYTIVIKKGDEVFCTLTFNADGQLLNIAFAPSREGNNRPVQYAEQMVNGYRFTVTGLTDATKYAYDITTKDAANKTIATYSGEFTTKSNVTTDMDNIQSPVTTCQKLLREGQLLILRDGKTYSVMGQEIE